MMVKASAKGGMLVSESRTVTIESVGNGLRSGCWCKLFAPSLATGCLGSGPGAILGSMMEIVEWDQRGPTN